MPLAPHGKRLIAESMYHRGKSFFQAAILLKQKGGHGYVVLHLKCQALEIMLKAFLLLKDYDKNQKKLRFFGHDLIYLSDATSSIYGMNEIRAPLRQELNTLNRFYKQHFLRYATVYDILVDPTTIPDSQVALRMMACIRLAERAFARQGASPPHITLPPSVG